jgi:hypothetical protein
MSRHIEKLWRFQLPHPGAGDRFSADVSSLVSLEVQMDLKSTRTGISAIHFCRLVTFPFYLCFTTCTPTQARPDIY